MSTHANMVKMTVSSVSATPSTGKGDITLNAASTGFQSFADAYGGNATVDILITKGAEWEVARNCTYTHSGTTLTRGTWEDSSNGTGAIVADNTAVVSVIAPASFGNATENVLGAWGALSGENSITAAATAVIGRLNVCSGTSANYPVTLPAVSGQTGKYIGFSMAPGLTRLVNVTTGADAVTKTGTVTGSTTMMTVGVGTVATSGSSTTLTGTGSTAFDTALRVGDTLYINGFKVYVDAIASATSLTMSSALSVNAGTGWSYIKTGIVGVDTLFTTEYTVGDGLTVGSDTREIVYIKSNTTLGLGRPFDTAPSGSAHGLTTVKIDGKYNRIMWANETALLYCNGSTWVKMAGKSIPMACGIYLNTTQSVSANTTTKADCATVNFDNTGLQADTTNKKILFNRTGTYQLSGVVRFNNPGATARCFSMFYINNGNVLAGECPSVAGTYPGPFITAAFEISDGHHVDLRGETSATGSGFYSSSSKETQLLCVEVPQW